MYYLTLLLMRNVSIEKMPFYFFSLYPFRNIGYSMAWCTRIKLRLIYRRSKVARRTSHLRTAHTFMHWETEYLSLALAHVKGMKWRKNGLVVHLSDYMLVRIMFFSFLFYFMIPSRLQWLLLWIYQFLRFAYFL